MWRIRLQVTKKSMTGLPPGTDPLNYFCHLENSKEWDILLELLGHEINFLVQEPAGD